MAKKIVAKKSNRSAGRSKKTGNGAARAQASNRYNLETLQPPRGSRHRKVRVGRGIGSKLGRTSGKGNKGQKSRRGYSRRRGFEGGQMPLHRRIPKRGFRSPFGKEFAVINLQDLNAFPAGETVTPDLLRAHGFVRTRQQVKVLGDGELQNKLAIHAHAFSGSAKDKITKAGGSYEVLAS
jgi:large subunit ribosomal protein L15